MAAIIQREFYRSARGPTSADEDVWRLVLDQSAMLLLVRHEWEAIGHSGADEFEVAEFLAQEGAAQTALIDVLFGRVPPMPKGPRGEKRPAGVIGYSLRPHRRADPKSRASG